LHEGSGSGEKSCDHKAMNTDAFTCCPEMAFISDPRGAIVEWNEALGRVFGRDIRQGTLLSDLVHPDDQAVFSAEWANVLKSEEPNHFECRMQAADQSYRTLSCSARQSLGRGEVYGMLTDARTDGDPGGLRSPAEVCTESMDPEEKRKKEDSDLLHHIELNVPVVVWVADRQGLLTHHSGLGVQRVGMKPGDWVGKSIFDLYAADHDGLENVRQALAGIAVHTSAEGHGMIWENWIVPVTGEDGSVTGAAGVSLDVTEMRRAERELSAKIDLIEKQQEVIRHLGTPVIAIWDGVLALPLVGAIDTARAAGLMSNVLAEIVRSGAFYAILDLTGVDAVDTTTAAHLVNLIRAVRLLGAEGIITGIRPTVAQTMISLGLNLSEIVTLGNLREGLKLCMRHMKRRARAAPS
jgi:rsbT co-antagonist protein RsbR